MRSMSLSPTRKRGVLHNPPVSGFEVALAPGFSSVPWFLRGGAIFQRLRRAQAFLHFLAAATRAQAVGQQRQLLGFTRLPDRPADAVGALTTPPFLGLGVQIATTQLSSAIPFQIQDDAI